ncbi:MAG: zinc-dependent metalloprotease [Actinomycetota bacterium]|nr:zinc-dependent metalloprotease [Actinomycetota bacterium]
MARLIEPWLAVAVARRFTGEDQLQNSYLIDRLYRDLEGAVPRAEELVAEASGIPAPPPVRWGVIDRARWVEANVAGMTRLIGPLGDKLAKRLETVPLPVRIAQRAALSIEVGVLLGYVSRRVLGQYDLLVPEDDIASPSLYFVGPNMVETERRHGFIPEEFTLWVAVHEVTHRFQFDGVPWLRPRFLELVHSYVGALELDAKGLAQRLAQAGRRLMSKGTPIGERNPIYLLASDEQRAMLDEIQALMAVVEGHGNYVMDSVGEQVIPSFRQMRHVFQRRREQTSRMQRALNHAIGLEMKMRQYEVGQRFCEVVVSREGPQALAQLWTDPDQFPSMAELREPERWLRRVAA